MLVPPVRRHLSLRWHAIVPDFGGDSATAPLVGSGFIEGHAKDSRGGGWLALDRRGRDSSADHVSRLLKQDDARDFWEEAGVRSSADALYELRAMGRLCEAGAGR